MIFNVDKKSPIVFNAPNPGIVSRISYNTNTKHINFSTYSGNFLGLFPPKEEWELRCIVMIKKYSDNWDYIAYSTFFPYNVVTTGRTLGIEYDVSSGIEYMVKFGWYCSATNWYPSYLTDYKEFTITIE